jgi:hypothetical protein
MSGHRSAATRSCCWTALLLTLLLAGPAASWAKQHTRLDVSLVPEHLGHGTTIKFGFQITASNGAIPSPVRQIDLRYPAHLGLITSGLGIASCTPALLEEQGIRGCPSRSLMGYGIATGEAEIGGEVIQEVGDTAVLMAPFTNEQINLEFYLEGASPLEAQLVFPGVLLPASRPYGGDLQIKVPLLSIVPEGPDIALVKLRSTIGPLGVTYWQRIHGQFVPYRPNGIILPPSCPLRGFPFAVTFTFNDETKTTSRLRVHCPRPKRH